MNKRLVIRFDGPPSHESGRFIEMELDGAGVSYGEWEQDGDDWLLVLPDADARCAQFQNCWPRENGVAIPLSDVLLNPGLIKLVLETLFIAIGSHAI